MQSRHRAPSDAACAYHQDIQTQKTCQLLLLVAAGLKELRANLHGKRLTSHHFSDTLKSRPGIDPGVGHISTQMQIGSCLEAFLSIHMV